MAKTNSGSNEQIDRLLKRPGARYFNLNPFDVLQLEPDAPLEEVKKQYRKLSILVHPDKNQDNADAKEAFEIISKAYQALQDDETLEFCRNVVNEARRRIDEEKQAAKKKPKKSENGAEEIEDTAALKMRISQLFVEIGQKKQRLEEREAAEIKRKREQELEEAEKRRLENEFNEKWEQQRDQRVNSWRSFVSGKKRDREKEKERDSAAIKAGKVLDSSKSKKKSRRTGLRPPALATESRPTT
jgi:DnaJ family protein C protein 8